MKWLGSARKKDSDRAARAAQVRAAADAKKRKYADSPCLRPWKVAAA
jgi:hypothetical protein